MTPKVRDKQLDEMLDKVRPENKHAETDWGPPVGKKFGVRKPGRFKGQIWAVDDFDKTPPDVIKAFEDGD